MRGIKINNLFFGAFATLVLTSLLLACRKPEKEKYVLPTVLHNGFLTLNEGLFQQNNATLTWYSIDQKKAYPQFFKQKNQLGLGDTGNDIKVYGGKIYIVVNNSHILHVLDKRTGKLLHQLTLSNNNSGSSPRHIDFNGAFAYVSAFDGHIFKIDTTTISIQQIATAGLNPEAIIAHHGKLFVSNSGGLNYPDMDSTISVIDPITMQEITRINVGKNPGKIIPDGFGHLWVSVRGDLSQNEGKLVKINQFSYAVEAVFDINCSSMTFGNGLLYISTYNFNAGTSSIVVFNPQTNEIINAAFVDGKLFETIYGIQYIEIGGQGIVLANDAKSYINQGNVYAFDLQGNLLFSYISGLNPNSSVYIP